MEVQKKTTMAVQKNRRLSVVKVQEKQWRKEKQINSVIFITIVLYDCYLLYIGTSTV